MKKGRSIMLLVCALTFTMVFGIFIGRNLNDEYAPIPDNRKQQILEQKEIINEIKDIYDTNVDRYAQYVLNY